MKRFLALLAIVSLIGSGCVSDSLGTSESGAVWIPFEEFQGYYTKRGADKVPDGASPNGQNTSANYGDRISIRQAGYDIFPDSDPASATTTGIGTMHTFRRRDGVSILMRAASSTLEWYDSHGEDWETLKTGYASDDFGFADNDVNTDKESYTYFGNSYQPFSRWTGDRTYLTATVASGAVTLSVADTSGFPATGSISYCGTEQAYSGKTATSFTVASAVDCPTDRGVAQAVETFSDMTTYPRGNIYLFADNRLWIAGTTSTPERVYFSGYGTSTQFDFDTLVNSSTAADPGLFNLAEGGGKVTAMVMDEGSIYVFKRSIIYKATLTDTLYSVVPLKSFDQKGQTMGAVNKRSTFSATNGVTFITPDNQIMLLQRVETIDYPQNTPISDSISPTVAGLDFSSSTGITFRDKEYIACKSSTDSTFNDTVLVFNLSTGMWDTPIVGWNVGDWAIYEDGGKEKLFFSNGTSLDTYEVLGVPIDSSYDTVASWRTKQYSFGVPTGLKYVENVYIEGYIAKNTTLTISLLLDEDGFTQTYSTTLSGEESAYIYDSSEYNVIGLSPFGTRRFGSNEDISGKKKFRIYLGKDFRQVPAYAAQLEFASDGQNQDWEVDGYAFLVRNAPVPEKRELFKSFK